MKQNLAPIRQLPAISATRQRQLDEANFVASLATFLGPGDQKGEAGRSCARHLDRGRASAARY